MDKKIVTSIGGLGNQMFCYAFYKKLCMEYPQQTFFMDISDVWDRRYERGAEFLHAFPNIMINEATLAEIRQIEHKFAFRYRGKGSRILRKLVDHINTKYMMSKRKYCVTEERFKDWKSTIPDSEWSNILYFDGYWQDVSYYEQYINELKKDFQFIKIDDKKNQFLMKEIETTESVSVHIRRGDYVGEILDILDTKYYSDIIKNIQQENPHSWFYFFSNDAEYVKKEYAWLKEKTIVEHNCGLESFRDMQLMSACKKNIIANSTFSIWAALLNDNPYKKVYYPSHYYAGIEMQNINLPGFVKMQVNKQKG